MQAGTQTTDGREPPLIASHIPDAILNSGGYVGLIFLAFREGGKYSLTSKTSVKFCHPIRHAIGIRRPAKDVLIDECQECLIAYRLRCPVFGFEFFNDLNRTGFAGDPNS